ncbi:hypothetical protein WJX73_007093 [Symbiochloris irregularis]|uniref:Protein kinase domain-containing protein n=1 Tax=Symbiochloris irregularis TaxID=706552 RepID=A0AAW1NNE3_9CHLO
MSLPPPAFYLGSDVFNWIPWVLPNGSTRTQTCKTFTSGWSAYDAAAVANLEPIQPASFESPLIGQQIPGYDYGCPGSLDPNHPDLYCRDYGPLQPLPYASTWVFNGTHASSNAVGAIAGGVFGGVNSGERYAAAYSHASPFSLSPRAASVPSSKFAPHDSLVGATSVRSQSSTNAGTRLLATMRSFGSDQNVAPPEWDIHPDDIRIAKLPGGKDHQLGAGGFGKVYKGYLHEVDPVAIKALKGEQDARLQASFLKEIDILRRSRHPHIVQYLGAVAAGNHTLLVCEFMEGGDLWTALSNDDTEYSWHKRGRHVALEVALALNYLHSHGCIHFDLKSANVLLTRTGTAKVADVGLARIMQTTQYTRADVILSAQCTPKADCFSFGVLLFEIITGEIPIRGQLRQPRVPEECSQDVANLMDRCLDTTPELRPDMRAIVEALRVLI